MEKIVEIWESDENFVGWAKEFSQKIGGDFREQFVKSWPKVRSHDTEVIACFVMYWTIRTGNIPSMIEIMKPMSVGFLAHMADTAQSLQREDLVEVINTMIFNIPRMESEIISEIRGIENEEE